MERPEIITREDGSLLIDGQFQIDELLESLGIDWNEEEDEDLGSINTIAGLVLLKLGHVPVEGESFLWKDYTFEVIDMDNNRIDKVLVTLQSQH